jgi:glycogen debranching enzyme
MVLPVDLHDDGELEARSVGRALVALAPGLDDRAVGAARALVSGELSSSLGVRSVAPGADGWAPRSYWRGPVWANITWLCARAFELHGDERLAGDLRARLVESVSAAGMREYLDGDSGLGLGARDFSWTAALTLRVVADGA